MPLQDIQELAEGFRDNLNTKAPGGPSSGSMYYRASFCPPRHSFVIVLPAVGVSL